MIVSDGKKRHIRNRGIYNQHSCVLSFYQICSDSIPKCVCVNCVGEFMYGLYCANLILLVDDISQYLQQQLLYLEAIRAIYSYGEKLIKCDFFFRLLVTPYLGCFLKQTSQLLVFITLWNSVGGVKEPILGPEEISFPFGVNSDTI